ncbi:alpha-amylase family glycosyl hydrolase [Rubrivivax gelatinosus]|uniref:alpha-amylase family glycosyl hydrolase n=1 Tax=Rubrivivax gelatinosus TaxID=28068 RepID=UPI000311034F|nr:alpha-amylase family glycosyl hydrolase [Rubrivivax gelatinosus]MBG6081781.1 1,4-alpha-glucan branching enzyme [Rubrivivax gelatinosus]
MNVRHTASSVRPVVEGMGALPTPEGCAFRVWAPHAEAVFVAGDFNGFAADAHALQPEADGYWYGFVEEARTGHEYKYMIHHAGQQLFRIDPYARQVTSSVGNGVIYDHAAFDWGDDQPQIRGHNELVIYELHVGSFFVREGEGRPGNFELALAKLDHLVKLGVNVVQVMPVAEFAGDYSWGYNPAHVFAVESAYGGPDAFKTFVKACHQRGLAVVLDVVYNHFGPSDLDLWRFDGWSENDKGGIYFYNDERSATPWGDTRPDYGREAVRRFIHDNAISWLRDFHLDGLRYDMTPYMRSVGGNGHDIPDGWSLMRWINTSVREQFPGRILIAEDMQHLPEISQVGDNGAAFHAQWDGAFVHPIREAAIVAADEHRDLHRVRDALQTRYNDDAFQRVIYTESHDEVANGRARVPADINPEDPTGWHAQKRSTAAAALVFTAPGIPMIFQGQEFLQGGWFRDDVPLDWDHSQQFRGILRLYRDLIALRRNLAGKTRGLQGQHIHVYHLNNDANVLAFQRWQDHGPGDDVVVVVNLGHEARSDYRIGMPTGGRWTLLLNSDAPVYGPDFDGHEAQSVVAEDEPYDGFGASAVVNVGAYSVLIYALE